MSSKFKKKHVDSLKSHNTSWNSPLSVIVHIDLDAYYAQCEQVRLNLPDTTPVVCRQWDSLIAVNYPARKFGIKRGDTISIAKTKCPDLKAPHVATFKKGETKWQWHENPNQQNYKVSLDPFRLKSRQIFRVFKQYCSVIEKASIDEAFFDLGEYVYDKLMSMFGKEFEVLMDKEDELPKCPTLESLQQLGLDWEGMLVDDDKEEIFDWDDICIIIAAQRVSEIRSALYKSENITCSAGIARNKILAKLGSGANKPNKQTIVTTSTIFKFLQQFSLTDMWGMGGKFGESVITALNIPNDLENSMEYLQSLDLSTMKARLGVTEGQRVYNLVHGLECSELVTRTDVKSMQSVKQFQSSALKSIDDCKQWIKVFSADLANRVLELDEELDKPIRPKTVVLGHGSYGDSTSKQAAFKNTMNKNLNFDQYYEVLLEAGLNLLKQVESKKKLIPCTMMRMAVSNMEKVGGGGASQSIDGFFGKSSLFSPSTSKDKIEKSEKPDKDENEKEKDEPRITESAPHLHLHSHLPVESEHEPKVVPPHEPQLDEPPSIDLAESEPDNEDEGDDLFVTEDTLIKCERCKKDIPNRQVDEHRDWHFAIDLQQRERMQQQQQVETQTHKRKQQQANNPSPSFKKQKPSKSSNDQSILKFFQKKK